MQFTALEARCADQRQMVETQLDWGLDAMVQIPPWLLTVPGDTADLRGLPVALDPRVEVCEWSIAGEGGERLLHKEYRTPAGPLSTTVRKTADWPYGEHIPFLDDYIVPRARKPLVTCADDLPKLRYLLTPPREAVARNLHAEARPLRELARQYDLLVSGGLGVGADMAGWLCGLENLMVQAIEEPTLVSELLDLIADWNLARMQVVLDEGVDLWVRRGWYEGCDFWSPRLYRQFILPHLQREAALAHSRGVAFGYIITSGFMPLLEMIIEAGVDVLIGVDPLMGGTDLERLREKTSGRLCLWGGVNGGLTVERGSAEEVRAAVQLALDTLAPGGGFILSPVDDVEDASALAWSNAQVLVAAWKEWRLARGMP